MAARGFLRIGVTGPGNRNIGAGHAPSLGAMRGGRQAGRLQTGWPAVPMDG